MKRKHFTEEQIAFTLRQAESGAAVTEVCRKLGITEQTFYRWAYENGVKLDFVRPGKPVENAYIDSSWITWTGLPLGRSATDRFL